MEKSISYNDKKQEFKIILMELDKIYKSWDKEKLKIESINYIKKWFIHRKINWYLRQALNHENNTINNSLNFNIKILIISIIIIAIFYIYKTYNNI